MLKILLLISLSMISCTKKSDETASSSSANEIVIGEVGSLTGNDATFGTSTRDGVELAVRQINESGGLLGKKVRVVVMDNQGKPEEAATAVTKLITQDKVVAILGEVASSRSLAMAPIAQRYKIPMISPSSTAVEVTKTGDYIFRVCFIDPFQGAVMAQFAHTSLNLKKVAVLRDMKSDYSVGLANFFVEKFKSLGGEIVADASYTAGDSDFKSQLTSLKGKNPEALFVPGYYTEVALIARQAKEMGLKVPLLGGDGWDSSKLFEIGGTNLKGSFFSNHYSPDDTSPLVQKFISEYKTIFNTIPDGLAALGYDAAMVLFDGIKRAGTTDSQPLRDALATTTNFAGVTGTITMNELRDTVKSAVIIEVTDNNYKFKERINP